MESQQIAPHHSHVHQSVEAGEDEDHEKKSMLKKVKAKAKKIKETITKHGHDHDHHGDHPQHYDLDEENDDNDEDGGVLKDPNLQGAPLYESAAIRSSATPTPAPTPQGEHRPVPDVGLGRSTVMHHHQTPPPAPTETTGRSAVDAGFTPKEKKVEFIDDSAVAPNTTMSLSPWRLEEDPNAPPKQAHAPPHSEVKASDPAAIGSQEAGASQIMDSFAKMKVNDKNQANRAGLSTGSHDQFSPDPNHPKMDENQAGDRHSSYAQKISAVGSAVAGTAISAKDFVASKLHYGGKTPGEGEDKGVSVKEYLAQKLEPGEDDRALSEAISEAFHKRNEEITKVTESEELTRRLGTEDNRETERSGTAAATATAARSVVDIVKDTVGSWMGKGGDHSPASHEQSEDNKKSEMRDDSKEAEVRIL